MPTVDRQPHRLPRPQRVLGSAKGVVPTKLALLEAKARRDNSSSGPSAQLPADSKAPRVPAPVFKPPKKPSFQSFGRREALPQSIQASDRLGPVVTLGTLTQDGQDWDVRAQRGRRGLVMVRTLTVAAGTMQERALNAVNHENIIKVLDVLLTNEMMELSFEYSRFTLAQVLHVHLKLEEKQIQCIAFAVSCLPTLTRLQELSSLDVQCAPSSRETQHDPSSSASNGHPLHDARSKDCAL